MINKTMERYLMGTTELIDDSEMDVDQIEQAYTHHQWREKRGKSGHVHTLIGLGLGQEMRCGISEGAG